jgi:single-strand DNA-binding protein
MISVIALGRLTRDVEMRYTQSAEPLAVGSFSIAVDRKDKEKKTDFFNCTAFGKTAENIEKFFKKGNKILVSGSLQNDKYTNKEGKEVTTTKIVVREFDFVESKSEKSESTEKKDGDGFMNIPDGIDEELPFT